MTSFFRLHHQDCIAILFLVAVTTYFWAPALFMNGTIIHGETARFGIPMMSMQPNIFERGNDILWSSSISGGHPLFAEGQGAFANPLRYLLSELFQPIFAYNAYHWTSMLAASTGIFFLGRFLGLGVVTATFASVATILSSSWLVSHANHATAGTLAWAPWFLLACEAWLKKHSVTSSILVAVSTTLLILSGYPQIAHGAAIYFLFSLIPEIWNTSRRRILAINCRPLLATGILAIVLTVGLSAVQLLPLLELVRESHRADGISLGLGTNSSAAHVFKGLFFSHFENKLYTESKLFNVIGSLLVTMLAALVLCTKMPTRITGHLIAAFVLFNLGIATVSPLFNLLYEFNLVPGLSSFRVMFFYIPIAVLGFSICAGHALDYLAKISSSEGQNDSAWSTPRFRTGALLTVATAVAVALAATVNERDFSRLNYGFVVLFLIGSLALISARKVKLIPACALIALVIECWFLRMSPFPFSSATIFREPVEATIIKTDPDYKLYRTFDTTLTRLH
jgi:hypothetical protein